MNNRRLSNLRLLDRLQQLLSTGDQLAHAVRCLARDDGIGQLSASERAALRATASEWDRLKLCGDPEET